MVRNRYQTVEEYLDGKPEELRETMEEMRKLVKREAPMAVEQVSGGTIAYFFHGVVVQFYGDKDSIFFCTSTACLRRFKKPLRNYQSDGKDTIQLPIQKRLPEALLKALIAFRIRENTDRRMAEMLGGRLPGKD